ncbi:MAG: ATP-binding protein [Deltaproteobacteria bacterium]|nr:ATP-binding protein [Deltaproteobacteria bacterium]
MGGGGPITSAAVEKQTSHFQSLSDSLAADPVCHLLVCTGSRERDAAAGLLRAFGVDAIGGSRFKVRPASRGDSQHQKWKIAITDGIYGFDDGNGWYYPALRDSLAEKLCGMPEAQVRALQRHSELSVLAGTELIRDVLTLPIPRRGYLRTFPLETEDERRTQSVQPSNRRDAVVLGMSLERQTEIALPLGDLSRHAFVAGVTGSGKTITMFNVLQQLATENIPFIVLEPAKSEYRALAGFTELYSKLRIYTPGRDGLSPLRLNPFAFEPHIPLATHISGLSAAFTCALDLFSPLPTILEGTLWDLYESRGWREYDLGSAEHSLPRVSDLADAVCSNIDSMGYDPEARDRLNGAIRSHFIRLSRGSVGRLFDCGRSSPLLAELCSTYSVIELGALAQSEANLLTMFLMTGIREYLSTAVGPMQRPRLVMVIEEAHNLVPAVPDEQSSNEATSAKVESSRYVSNMLAEMRALGLAIIVVDQTPAAVAPQVVRNTNLKIAHRTVAREDRETLADAMLMHPAHAELLGRLTPGQAFIYADRFFRPHLACAPLRVPDLSLSGTPRDRDSSVTPPTDADVQEWIAKHDWYRDSVGRRIEDMDAKVASIYPTIIVFSKAITDAANELAVLINDIAKVEGGDANSNMERRTRFDKARESYVLARNRLKVWLQTEIRTHERIVRSLEAELQSVTEAAKRIRLEEPSTQLLDQCRDTLTEAIKFASQLTEFVPQ